MTFLSTSQVKEISAVFPEYPQDELSDARSYLAYCQGEVARLQAAHAPWTELVEAQVLLGEAETRLAVLETGEQA